MLQETKKECMFASIKDATLDFQVTGNWYLNQHKVAEGHQKVNETRGRKKKQTFIESDSEQSDSEVSSRTRSSRQKKNQSVTLSVAKSRRSKRSRN